MEELITLQHGSFTILEERVREYAQRTGCPNQVADWTLQVQLYVNTLRREHLNGNATWHWEWGLFLLEYLLHNTASMRRKECWRCFQAPQVETAEVMVPKHPSLWTLLGFTDGEILKVTEKVYLGEYVTVPSVLPCQWQEECIKELCLELAQHMARAGLQSGPRPARPTSQSRGHSHGQVQSPSSKPQGTEVTKCPREDPSTQQSGSRRQHSHSRCRSQSQRHQSPLPQHLGRCQPPYPSLPGSHPGDEWLSCSLGDLHLHPLPQESWSRT